MERSRYVERRLARLDAADTAALALPDGALATQIASERDLLRAAAGWEVSDRTVRAQGQQTLRRWFSLGQGARTKILSDPTLGALGEVARTTQPLDLLLQVTPTGHPDEVWLGNFRTALIAAGGVEEGAAAFDEALFAAYREWFLAGPHPHQYPFDDVAVLLPVRLETYFPDDTRLWLRVVPDEASIRRDNPAVVADEVEALNAFWSEALKANGLTGWLQRPRVLFDLAGTGVAWGRLAARVTPQRAAWLVPAFLPTHGSLAIGRPAVEIPEQRRTTAHAFANHVAGFPEAIDVWAVWGSDPSLRRLTPSSPKVPIDPDRLVLNPERIDASRRHLAGETIPVEDRAWWMDWDAAQAVGLGLAFDLPAGCTPATLQALYVTGQSDEPATDLFRAHAEAGELAVLPLGMPTNAVAANGIQPGPPPDDPDTWRGVASRRFPQIVGVGVAGVTSLLSTAISGDQNALPALPGDQDILLEETPEMSLILSRALWPALRGHLWRDIFGMRDDTEALRRWAQENFAPEGPWCPICIGDQPYGLLPVSVLDGWETEAGLPDDTARVEERLVAQLRPIREAWARAARRTGTVRGRDAAGFLDLLGKDAITRQYAYQWFLPAEFFAIPYILEGYLPPSADPLLQNLRETYERFDAMLGTGLPERFYVTRGGSSDLQLALVRPTAWRDPLQLTQVTDNIARGLAAPEALEIYFNHEAIPRSLLVRLLIYAAFITTGAIGQEQEERRPGGLRLSLLNPLIIWTENATAVEEARKRFVPDQQRDPSDVLEQIRVVAKMLDSMQEIYRTPATAAQPANLPRQEDGMERALRATLDAASHRIDPWITGMAARRAKAAANSTSANLCLGIYGWLDGPFVGSPGPTNGGLLHTPSHAQTLSAVILRDKYLTSRLEGDADATNTWAMSLDSQSVRLAAELAEEVRIGAHIYEVLGRRVEQAVGTRDRVASLRQAFPLRAAAVPRDRNTVCDGVAALRDAMLRPGSNSLYDRLDEDQRKRIDLLRRAADVYGDLLVAEAVHDVVSGRPDGANAAMEAAAGLGKPAALEFVQTPDSGIALKSSVLSVLPAVADGPALATRPAAMADASAAAWISGALSTGWDWRVLWWRTGQPGAVEFPEAIVTVTLADMDLTPADAALLPENILNGIAVAIARGRLPAGVAVAAAPLHGETAAPARHAQARRLVGLLGGPPATAEEFAPSGPVTEAADVGWMAGVDSAIATELRGRYQRLLAAAQDLLARLQIPSLGKLREALLWGLLPGSAPDAQANALTLLYGHVHDGDLMTALAQAAATSLKHRLDGAPPAMPAANPSATDLSERSLRRPQEIARAIAELGSADGHMAILARIDRATFVAQCALTPDSTLEIDWLTTVAAVRRDLAQIEAWNLEAKLDGALPVLAPFCNAPGDPWLLDAAAKADAARTEVAVPGRQRTRPWTPHLVAAFADPAWQAAPSIAIGLVDGWTETVPTPRRSTRAAFGFNAPAARAPQAILLAVPPAPRTWLSPDTLAAIVAEARTLAHARGARLEDLVADYRAEFAANPDDPPVPYQDLRATMMLQTAPFTGIDLIDRTWWDGP
jgi:hypothetical protein